MSFQLDTPNAQYDQKQSGDKNNTQLKLKQTKNKKLRQNF